MPLQLGSAQRGLIIVQVLLLLCIVIAILGGKILEESVANRAYQSFKLDVLQLLSPAFLIRFVSLCISAICNHSVLNKCLFCTTKQVAGQSSVIFEMYYLSIVKERREFKRPLFPDDVIFVCVHINSCGTANSKLRSS